VEGREIEDTSMEEGMHGVKRVYETVMMKQHPSDMEWR
jgi:hypothetical protein